MRTLTLAAALVLLAAALAGPLQAATAEQAQQAIADATAARKQAGAVGGEWRDTSKMIRAAQKAAKKGDFDKAVKLASDAKFQGEAGQAQALAEQSAGQAMPNYMKAALQQ